MRVLLSTEKGILGHYNCTEWNKQKWYIKVLGFFFKSIKNKYITVEGYISDIDTSTFKDGKEVYLGEIKPLELNDDVYDI